jgi:D-amino-acid dehydrogenase
MSADHPNALAIIGAGIVGAAIAFEVQRREIEKGSGRQVILIDRDSPGMGASFGNMASIAVTEFLPASRPSIWAQVPGWLMNPEGPMRLRLSYAPQMIPWFLRFIEASRPSRVRALGEAGAKLCQRALADTEQMLAQAGLGDMLSQTGCLCLFDKASEMKGNREHLELLERLGFEFETLNPGQADSLEPALTRRLSHVLRFPNNRSISSPYQLVLRLIEQFQVLGGTVIHGSVGTIERSSAGVDALHLTDGRRIPVSQAIVCAGIHSRELSKQLGEPIPLETERGYHTQIMAPGITLNHSLIWPARAFMITPTAGGIRVGGTVELAGLSHPPDYRRARVLVRHAQEVLPDLQSAEISEWMGHRPALPDTIPVISPSAKTNGVFYATGHGHLGLTNAATTARIIADMVNSQQPPVDPHPYRVDRF